MRRHRSLESFIDEIATAIIEQGDDCPLISMPDEGSPEEDKLRDDLISALKTIFEPLST